MTICHTIAKAGTLVQGHLSIRADGFQRFVVALSDWSTSFAKMMKLEEVLSDGTFPHTARHLL
jgi:hypothetical protein